MSSSEESDEALAAASQAGSITAFETLVRRYQPRILRFLENQLGNHEDARDITQQAFLQAYRSLARFKLGSPFAPWLFAIARYQGIDFLRHRGSRRDLDQRFAQEAESKDVPDPATLLDINERIEQRWQWVRQHLDQRSYQILWLHLQEEMEIRDIAEVMKLTRSHVKVLLFRARRTLRGQFESENVPTNTTSSVQVSKSIPHPNSPQR